jgi:hypothetical protein
MIWAIIFGSSLPQFSICPQALRVAAMISAAIYVRVSTTRKSLHGDITLFRSESRCGSNRIVGSIFIYSRLSLRQFPRIPSVLGQEVKRAFPGSNWGRIAKPEEVGYSSAKFDALPIWLKTLQTKAHLVSVDGRLPTVRAGHHLDGQLLLIAR